MARAIEGTFRTTANGRTQVRIQGKSIGTFDTEPEAKRECVKKLLLLESKDVANRSNALGSPNSLQALRESFFKWREEKEIEDIRNETGRWDLHLADAPFYTWDVRRITIDDVDEHMLKLANKKQAPKFAGTDPVTGLERDRSKLPKLARATQKQVKQLLVHALDRYRKLLNGVNVAKGFKVPKQKRTKRGWDFLLREEIPKVLAALDPPARWFAQFAIGTGVRIGEQYMIHVKDVDVTSSNPHVWIRHGGMKKKKTGRDTLKSAKSGEPRQVPLFGMGLEAAREMLKALDAYCPSNPNKLLFPRPGGTYYDANAYIPQWEIPHSNKKQRAAARKLKHVNGFRPPLMKAGIERRIRWHDLRHTAATRLVNGWDSPPWTLLEVATLLGHSSIAMVQKYAHQASMEETANRTDPNRGLSLSA